MYRLIQSQSVRSRRGGAVFEAQYLPDLVEQLELGIGVMSQNGTPASDSSARASGLALTSMIHTFTLLKGCE
jgi:hypothetical protein